MRKTYYHATPFTNLDSILEYGIRRSMEGIVYLTTKPEDAVKFIAIRGYKDILVCQVSVDEELVEESFDHNERFFKCRAYAYSQDILPIEIEEFLRYEIN